jgi:hypothetical protein
MVRGEMTLKNQGIGANEAKKETTSGNEPQADGSRSVS